MMGSRGRASPFRSPRKRKSVSAQRAGHETQPEDGPHSYAEYLARRRRLVSAIEDEVDEHALRMEVRARQAVAHAAALIQSSRAQEKECLAHLRQLQDRVQEMQEARRTAATELRTFQQRSEAIREELEGELQRLRHSVEEARRELRTLQHEQQQYQQRRDEEAESQLRAQTATVEVRFQRAVDLLQAQVQERKAWADEQCAACEARVQEAVGRADAAEFGSLLPQSKDGAPTPLPGDASTRSAVERQMRQLEHEMEQLAQSADARMAAIAAEQRAAKAELRELQGSVARKKRELQELSMQVQEASSVVETLEAVPPPADVCKTTTATEPNSSTSTVAVCDAPLVEEALPPSLPNSVYHGKKDAAAVSTKKEHRQIEQRLDDSLPKPIRDGHHLRSPTTSPDEPPLPRTQETISRLRESSTTASAPSPLRGETSFSVSHHEPTVVSDISCSFDAFLAVSPLKKRAL